MIDCLVANKEIILKDTPHEIVTDKKRYTRLKSGIQSQWIMHDKEVRDEPETKFRVEDLLISGLPKSSGRGEEFLRTPTIQTVYSMDAPTLIKMPEKISK